jgi:hypothetical protein
MRTFLWAGIVFGTLSAVAVSADNKGASVTEIVKELKPSPYADKGGLGRILLADGNGDIVFHIMKTTKITKIVDGKAQPANYEDVKKGDLVRATYDGRLMQSEPPQAWTIELVILKPAK